MQEEPTQVVPATHEERMRLAAERYFLLIKQLGQEMNYARGWKSVVARTLGVHPSFVSKVVSGKVHSVGLEIIERAIDRLALGREWFFAIDPDPGVGRPLHYDNHRGRSRDSFEAQALRQAERLEMRASMPVGELDGRLVRDWGRLGMHAMGTLRDMAERRGNLTVRRAADLSAAVLELEIVELAQTVANAVVHERGEYCSGAVRDRALRLSALVLDLFGGEDEPHVLIPPGDVDVEKWAEMVVSARRASLEREIAEYKRQGTMTREERLAEHPPLRVRTAAERAADEEARRAFWAHRQKVEDEAAAALEEERRRAKKNE